MKFVATVAEVVVPPSSAPNRAANRPSAGAPLSRRQAESNCGNRLEAAALHDGIREMSRADHRPAIALTPCPTFSTCRSAVVMPPVTSSVVSVLILLMTVRSSINTASVLV